MENVTWTKESFIVNGNPITILSGEIHYFRISREDWPDRLMKLRQAGLNTVAFYIPWEWHEYEEGKYDFTGMTHPQKDLAGWLELSQKMGLYAIPRIGPYIYSEWKNSGIPEWLVKNYPEIRCHGHGEIAKGGALVAVEGYLVSYLNDTFLAHVQRWYDKLSHLFKKHLITNGGNIIFIQPDNEIGGIVPFDFQEHVIARYRKWLREKYSNIEALNRAHRASYKDFEDIHPPATNPREYQELKRWFDWDRFRYAYYSLYAAKLTDILRKKGMDVPFIYNCPMEPTYHYDIARNQRDDGLVGIDHYPMCDENHPVFDYHVLPKLIFNLELTREIIDNAPLFLPECQVGSWHDIPRIYPADLELFYRTSVAHGAQAFSFYQFAGGENPLDFGKISKYYDYQAPIARSGELRPHYQTVKEFASWLKQEPDVLKTKKDYDVGYGFYFPYHAFYPCYPKTFDFGDTSSLGFHIDLKKALEPLLYHGMLKSLTLAGVNYELVDLERADTEHLKKYPQLWVFSLDFMAASVQEKLLRYAEEGGKLILNPMLPWLDENMNECRIIEKRLYLKRKTTKKIERGRIDVLDIIQLPVRQVLEEYEVGKNTKVIATTLEGKPCGIEVSLGKGRVTVLGGGFKYLLRIHERLIRKILEKDNITLQVTSDNPEILAFKRSGKGKTYIFVFNYHGMDMDTIIRTEIDGKKIRLPSKGSLHLPQRSSQVFRV